MKYDIANPSFFDNIQTDDQGYLLGLIASDGNISKRGYRIAFEQSSKDLEVIWHIQKLLGSNHPIRQYRPNKAFYALHSKELVAGLRKHGITEAKTKTLVIQNLSSLKAKVGYTRGLLDGDGSVYYRLEQGKMRDRRVSWLGTLGALKPVEDVLKSFQIYYKIKLSHSDFLYRIEIKRKEDLKTLYSGLYPVGCCALSRKRLAFEQLF